MYIDLERMKEKNGLPMSSSWIVSKKVNNEDCLRSTTDDVWDVTKMADVICHDLNDKLFSDEDRDIYWNQYNNNNTQSNTISNSDCQLFNVVTFVDSFQSQSYDEERSVDYNNTYEPNHRRCRHFDPNHRVRFYDTDLDQADRIVQEEDKEEEDYGYYFDCSIEDNNNTTSKVSVTYHYYCDDISHDEAMPSLLYYSQDEINEMKADAKTDGYIYCFELAPLCDQLLESYYTQSGGNLCYYDAFHNTSAVSSDKAEYITTKSSYDCSDSSIASLTISSSSSSSDSEGSPAWIQTVYEWSNSPARGLEHKVSSPQALERKRVISSIVEGYRVLKQQQHQQQQYNRTNPNMRTAGLYKQQKDYDDDIHECLREYSVHQTKLARDFASMLAVGDSLVVKSANR